MPEYARRLAVVVKRTRTELDLTQEEVAEKSGTDVRTIITFEQGCGNPTLKTLYAVVRVLKIDTREIFDDAPQTDSFAIRQLHALVNECSEEEAHTLLPVIKAVLTALRSSKGYNIE